MRQALREVAEKVARLALQFFGVEAEVVGEADELVHQGGGLLEAPLAGIGVGEPARAGEEGARLIGPAVDERAAAELVLDGVDSADQARGGGVIVVGKDGEEQ